MNDKYLTIKKLRDPKFYLETFTKIKGKVPGKLIPFILNEAQKDLFNTVRKNSRVIILKARQIGFCLDKNTRILSSNLEWIKLDDVKVGQEVVAVDEKISGGKGSARKIKTAIVENKFDVYESAIKITMDNGTELTATPSHKFLFKDSHLCKMVWKRVDELRIGDESGLITSRWGEKTYEDGWLSGMIDGEGSLAKPSRTGVSLTISQVSGSVWDRLKRYAVSNNIRHRIEVDRRKAGDSSKLGSKEVNKLVISNMFDVLRIIGKTAPSRLLGRHFWEGKRLGFVVRPKIVKIEHLPKQRMIDLQTSAKTYIAEGIVSHNSTAMTGFFYHNTIMNPGTTTALIGYNSELTAELLDKVKTFYRSTPKDLQPTVHYNSKYEISYPRIDSKILVLPSTENVGRGYTLTNVLATELSAWEKQEEKMSTLEASVPIKGRLVIESTPRGQGNLYHRMCMADDNGYAKQEYGWWWGYCLDDETEILTVKGWKKRKDFNIGDKHFTVNLKTKKLEIKVATDKIDHIFSGKMIHFKNQNLDMMVTPNHRCIVESAKEYQSSGKWTLKQAKNLDKLDYIPLSTKGWDNKKKKYSDDFVELIGWIITEASFEKYLIYIYQNIGNNLDRIEELCKKLEYKYTKYIRKNRPCGEIRIHSEYTKSIRKILEGKSKNLPINFLLRLTFNQLILLQRTMIMADGYVDGDVKKRAELCDSKCSFVQKDKQVSDNFQILTTLIGNSSIIKQNKTIDKCYVVRVKKDKVSQKFSKIYKEYNGHIWCPTNENGTIIIRRNGRVMITGQSKEEMEMIRKRMNNPRKFAQEYGLEFLASGRSVFDQMIIKKQRKNILRVGYKVTDEATGEEYEVREEDGWRFYRKPAKDGLYVMGVDVSEGVEGGDYSVAIIWDRKTGEEVAMFRALVPPDILAKRVDKWGRIYNNALMVVEINNHGLTTVTVLRQLIYPSLYFRQAKFETIGQQSSDKIGWKTTKLTRPLLIDDFAQAIRDGLLTIHSRELLNEMSVFVYNDNGDMQPQEGFHDDCLKKGTLIKTINGYKEIEEILPGELVLTHKGRYRKVEKCLEKPFSNTWYDLNINGQLNLELSYNHPIYCATGEYKKTNRYVRKTDSGLGTGITELVGHNKRQWKLPSKLLKSYKPISIIEDFNSCSNRVIDGVDNKWGYGKKKIMIIFDKDFSKFLGLFLAEGHCCKESNQMSLAFHERDTDLLNEMKSYLLNIGLHVQEKHIEETHCRVLYFVSKTLRMLMEDCYDKHGEKILPYYHKELGNNLIYTLEYWLKGDGWNDKQFVYDKIGATTSKKLALGMRDISWSAGYYATIHKVARYRYEVQNKDQYYVNIKYTKNKNQHLEQLSNFEFGGKIHNIKKDFYTGTVYNLQVEEDESFIADGVVVHNCIFAGGIGFQGFKVMYSGPLTQLDYQNHMPINFAY